MEEKLSKSRLSRYIQLRHKKHREERGEFVAEGEKSVLENLRGFEVSALVATRSWLDRHSCEVAEYGIDSVYVAERDKMERLSSLSTSPEVIAVFKQPQRRTGGHRPKPGLYLALDGIQDPGNLGTIIRTADWFGIREIFASHDTVDVYNSKTVQATMGSLSRVRVTYTDLRQLFADNPDFPVYGTLLEGEDIYTAELSSTGFIVMGNEGKGISPSVRDCLTSGLLLPPYDSSSAHAESLNVGVATALVVGEFRRREKYRGSGKR